MHISKPRLNAHFNETQPEEYSDYINYKIKTGYIDNYKICERMGRGKAVDMFLGVEVEDDKPIAIKVLKPMREIKKVKREIKILKSLNHPNIVKLKDVVVDRSSDIYSLIFDYIPHHDASKLFDTFGIEDICLYSKQILEALKHAHSRGIMHRDIKPQSMIIKEKTKTLYLKNWGQSDYYHIGKNYSVRVSARYYKSPELLVGYPYYDYSTDMWSFGCVLAEMLFKKKLMFLGTNIPSQLQKIVKYLGVNDLEVYLKKYDIPVNISNFSDLPRDRVDFSIFLQEDCDPRYLLAVNLLEKLLVYDHVTRYTAEECLEHPFFNNNL